MIYNLNMSHKQTGINYAHVDLFRGISNCIFQGRYTTLVGLVLMSIVAFMMNNTEHVCIARIEQVFKLCIFCA